MRRKPCLDFVLPGYVATWADREERVEGGGGDVSETRCTVEE